MVWKICYLYCPVGTGTYIKLGGITIAHATFNYLVIGGDITIVLLLYDVELKCD